MPRKPTSQAAGPEAPEVEPQDSVPEPQLHVFTGPVPLYYPEARDALGRLVAASESCPKVRAGRKHRRVEPGDCRILTAPLDPRWRLATQAELGAWLETADDAAALAALGIEQPLEHPGTGVQMTAVEHPADGTLSPAISNDNGTAQ